MNKEKSAGIKAAKRILVSLGLILALYGLAVLAVIGLGAWFNYVFLAGGLILIVIGCFLPKVLKLNKWLLRAVCFVLILCLCNFGIYEGKAVSMGHRGAAMKSSGEAFDGIAPKWIIVLGAKVNSDSRPKLEYMVRLEKAIRIYTKESTLILTGGKGADEPLSEAQCGYNWIMDTTKPEQWKEIILEDKSTSTTENLKNSLEIIKARGGSENDSVLIISSNFHLYRASVIAGRVGFTNTAFAGNTGLRILIPYYYVREYAAYVRECF